MRGVRRWINRVVYRCPWRAARMVILVVVVHVFCGWAGCGSRDRGARGENVACFDRMERRVRMCGSVRTRANAAAMCADYIDDQSTDELGVRSHNGRLLPCGEPRAVRKYSSRRRCEDFCKANRRVRAIDRKGVRLAVFAIRVRALVHLSTSFTAATELDARVACAFCLPYVLDARGFESADSRRWCAGDQSLFLGIVCGIGDLGWVWNE